MNLSSKKSLQRKLFLVHIGFVTKLKFVFMIYDTFSTCKLVVQ